MFDSLQSHGHTVHGILQARILEWVAIPSPGDLPYPGIKPRSPALQVDSLPAEPPGKPINEMLLLLLLSRVRRVRLCATPWTVDFTSPGDLPYPGIKPRSPALKVDSLLSEPPGKPIVKQ